MFPPLRVEISCRVLDDGEAADMKAMILETLTRLDTEKQPLSLVTLPNPVHGEGKGLIRVSACGVCHTEKGG